MPWCPECKEEYVEGMEVCADCGAPLVDELPDAFAAEGVQREAPVLLTTVSGEAESTMLRARLEDAGIAVMLVDKKAGGYLRMMMGYSTAPVDVYVEESRLNDAREVLAASWETDDGQEPLPDDDEEYAFAQDEGDEEDEDGEEDDYGELEDFMYRRSYSKSVIMGFAVLAGLLAIYMVVRYFIPMLFR